MNVSHKKKWNAGVIQIHVGTLLTPLTKSKRDEKVDKDFFNEIV